MRHKLNGAFLVPAFLLYMAATAIGQAAADDRTDSVRVQARGYWVDPETGLMWAGHDNGKDVSWHGAQVYCRKLKISGFADWRLADVDELWAIFERNKVPPRMPPNIDYVVGGHVRGSLIISGSEWSVTRPIEEDGNPSAFAYSFDFRNGRDLKRDASRFAGDSHGLRALCVRGAQSNTQP